MIKECADCGSEYETDDEFSSFCSEGCALWFLDSDTVRWDIDEQTEEDNA